MSLLTLQAFSAALSISPATGKNWLKQGKITPTCWQEEQPMFSEAYLATYQRQLQSGAKQALKSRRNKTYISGSDLYKSYIDHNSHNAQVIAKLCDTLSSLEDTDNMVTIYATEIMYLLLADCSIQLLSQAILGKKRTCKSGDIFHTDYPSELHSCIEYLLNPILTQISNIEMLSTTYAPLFETQYLYLPKEDTLGFLYMSLKSMTERKATGAYYTPTSVVNTLISSLAIKKDNLPHTTFLDPCCGTGNFLLQLPGKVDIMKMYGFDIDATSVLLTRINMALRTKGKHIDIIMSHFIKKDYLLDITPDSTFGQYDVILGNPPWGFAFDDITVQKLKPLYECGKARRIESYDLFVERSLSLLSKDGILSFVLPEAILQVKNHHRIRNYMMHHSRLCSIKYLGNIFYKVLCPCIILQLSRSSTGFSCKKATITMPDKQYHINIERDFHTDGFFFTCDDKQYALIQKMNHGANIQTLREQADFALGIVTGNNDSFLSEQPKEQYEPIIRGVDLTKYHIADSTSYLRFQPHILQQAADERLYREPEKLCYRFISEQLVFAYDTSKRLSLNSCNILIPRIPDVQIKYVMALLNSRMHQFIFYTYFHSVKVLRSHLEELPIPVVSLAKQNDIIQQVDLLMDCQDTLLKLALYDRLDQSIANLFGLTPKEYNLICESTKKCTLFL